MRRKEQAPGWARWAIEQARPKIVATVGPALLPSSWEVLGCGVFGCTMETSDSAWICKVTLDGTEAFLAGALERIGGAHPGLCPYLEPIRLESEAGPVWILWRARVEMPTLEDFKEPYEGLPDYSELKYSRFDELAGKKSAHKHVGNDPLIRRSLQSKLPEEDGDEFGAWWDEVEAMKLADEKARGIDFEDILSEMTSCGLAVASYLKVRSLEGAGIGEFIDEVGRGVVEYADDFSPHQSMHYWHYGRDGESGGLHTAALRLLGYRFQLQRLQGNALVAELASTLGELTRRGILLCDLNRDNIARLGGVWTLFDGGFCVPISDGWVPLWNRVKPNLSHWWSNKGWEPLEGLVSSDPDLPPQGR